MSSRILALLDGQNRQVKEGPGRVLLVAYLPPACQGLPCQRAGCCIVALQPGDVAQQIEGEGDACGVSQFPVQQQALLSQCSSLSINPLLESQVRSSAQCFRTHRHRDAFASHQCLPQEALAFTPVTVLQPEPPECSTQLQGQLIALPGLSL